MVSCDDFTQKYPEVIEAGLKVEQVQPELAPKLTGMLLQLGEDECWACPLDALDPAPPAPVASKVARWEIPELNEVKWRFFMGK